MVLGGAVLPHGGRLAIGLHCHMVLCQHQLGNFHLCSFCLCTHFFSSHYHSLRHPIDSNGIFSGCHDSIALWRVFRCPHPIPVAECLYFFGSNVPNDGCLVRCKDESSRVRQEIDSNDVPVLPVCKDLFVCLCIPHKHIAYDCPCCDPFPVVRHSKTPGIIPLLPYVCHLPLAALQPHCHCC